MKKYTYRKLFDVILDKKVKSLSFPGTMTLHRVIACTEKEKPFYVEVINMFFDWQDQYPWVVITGWLLHIYM